MWAAITTGKVPQKLPGNVPVLPPMMKTNRSPMSLYLVITVVIGAGVRKPLFVVNEKIGNRKRGENRAFSPSAKILRKPDFLIIFSKLQPSLR